MPDLKTITNNYKDLGCIYSNMDHSFNFKEIPLEKLKSGKYYAQHAAWDFCGYIYYKDGIFFEEIWIYHSLTVILECDNIEDLVNIANDKYGSE